MLADVAQEVDRRHRRGPVEVVDHHARRSRPRRPGTARSGRGCCSHPGRDGLRGDQRPLGVRPGVADQAGRPAGERDRPVPGQLQPAQRSAAARGGRRAGSARSGRSPVEVTGPRRGPRAGRRVGASARSGRATAGRRGARRRRSRGSRASLGSGRLPAQPPLDAGPTATPTAGPVRRHRRLAVQPEPPRRDRAAPATPTRGPVRTTAPRRAGAPGQQPQARTAGRAGRRRRALPSMPRATVSRAGPRARSAVDAPPAAASGPASQPVDHLAGAQQHGGGLALRAADDVHAPVHAVGEVDVERARAGRTSPRCAACGRGRRASRGRRSPAYASTSVSRTVTAGRLT